MRLIVAVDEKWGIGKKNDLLVSIPDDMRHYIETTRGKVVVMGYSTLLSLPGSKPQPGRLNLILADIKDLRVSGAVVCESIPQLLELIGCFEPDEVFDIGGGSMYRQLLPYCDRAHITKMRFDGEAEVFIPNLDEDENWRVEEEGEMKAFEDIRYSFVTYANTAVTPIKERASRCGAMAQYFKKREPIEFDYLVDADEDYKKAFCALLRAYFFPLENGFSADDVTAFLADQSGCTFETYLKEKGLIADKSDFDRFAEKTNPEKKATVRIRLEKAQLDAFEQARSYESFA